MMCSTSEPDQDDGNVSWDLRSRFAVHTQWGVYEDTPNQGDSDQVVLEFRKEPQFEPRVLSVPIDHSIVELQVVYPGIVVSCLPGTTVATRRHIRFGQWIRRSVSDGSDSGRATTQTMVHLPWSSDNGINRREDRLDDCCRVFASVSPEEEELTLRTGGKRVFVYDSVILVGLCNRASPNRWIARAHWGADIQVEWPKDGSTVTVVTSFLGFRDDVQIAKPGAEVTFPERLDPPPAKVLAEAAAHCPISTFANTCM